MAGSAAMSVFGHSVAAAASVAPTSKANAKP
jgi:hypothetical protein